MFYSGICFGTNNLEEAGFFYDVVFKTIKVIRCQTTDNEIGYGYSLDQECFWLIKPYNKEPATRGNGSQMIITAKSKEEVDSSKINKSDLKIVTDGNELSYLDLANQGYILIMIKIGGQIPVVR